MNNKSISQALGIWLCFSILSTNVFAADFEDAMHAMREGNFAEAYCMLRPLAVSGDAEAQYNIGWMYLNGYGLAINDSLALEWWQRAADQGYTDARFSLAMLYSLGEGQVKKDPDLALDYYLAAMDDGHEDAILIVKSKLLRNDKTIRSRAREIIKKYADVLGEKHQVHVKRANVRGGPGQQHKIRKVLDKGAVVIELLRENKWSQIVLPEDDEILWVFSALLEPYNDPGN